MMTIRGPTAPKIYTIGYEGLGLEDFVVRLRRAGVRIVIDVRELPLSRKRGFSKGALAEALATARIRYSHMRSLGCPKPIRDRHRANMSRAASPPFPAAKCFTSMRPAF
jgi:uncharacterized protein (DUF488 family)